MLLPRVLLLTLIRGADNRQRDLTFCRETATCMTCIIFPKEVQQWDISVWEEKEFHQNCSDERIGTIKRCYKGMEEYF